MAKSDAARKASSRAANPGQGRKEFPMPPAVSDAVQRICDRSGCEDWREVLTWAVFNLDKMNDEQFRKCMAIPRHDVSALVDKYMG